MADPDLDPLRLPRLRGEALAQASSFAAAARRRPRGTPRLVGRVIDGGAMPAQTERVFLVNPARIDGAEAEGQSGSIVAEAGRAVPVVVIGSRVPAAGDALIALSVGGRWVFRYDG